MKNKGQAAMEFLMTYGWAILVVLAAIGALAYFGVLSPQKLLPDRTTYTAPLPNIDLAVIDSGDSSVEVAFRNNVGVKINVTGGNGTGACAASTVAAVNDVANGDTFLVKWSGCTSDNVGEKFDEELTFTYVNTETGQERRHTGSVQGKWS